MVWSFSLRILHYLHCYSIYFMVKIQLFRSHFHIKYLHFFLSVLLNPNLHIIEINVHPSCVLWWGTGNFEILLKRKTLGSSFRKQMKTKKHFCGEKYTHPFPTFFFAAVLFEKKGLERFATGGLSQKETNTASEEIFSLSSLSQINKGVLRFGLIRHWGLSSGQGKETTRTDSWWRRCASLEGRDRQKVPVTDITWRKCKLPKV